MRDFDTYLKPQQPGGEHWEWYIYREVKSKESRVLGIGSQIEGLGETHPNFQYICISIFWMKHHFEMTIPSLIMIILIQVNSKLCSQRV